MLWLNNIDHFLQQYQYESVRIGFLLAFLLPIFVIYPLSKWLFAELGKHLDSKLLPFMAAINMPLRLYLSKTAIYFLCHVVAAYFNLQLPPIGKQLSLAAGFVILIFALWRIIVFVEAAILENRQDATLAQVVGNILKIFLLFVFVLGLLHISGVSISAMLAFGGMGGLVVGMAAKDLLANIFGSFMIILDKPFKVGDWIRSPDREIEGMVEKIGLRITSIRTFDKRPIYIPNSVFASIIVENPDRMSLRRIKEVVGIRHQDAPKMGLIIEQIENYLFANADIMNGDKPSAHFDSFGPSSLNILINAYCIKTSKIEYQRVKQQILLAVVDIILKNGAKCAQPVARIHMEPQHEN